MLDQDAVYYRLRHVAPQMELLSGTGRDKSKRNADSFFHMYTADRTVSKITSNNEKQGYNSLRTCFTSPSHFADGFLQQISICTFLSQTELPGLQTLDYQNKRSLTANQQPHVSYSRVPLYFYDYHTQGNKTVRCHLLYIITYVTLDTNHTEYQETIEKMPNKNADRQQKIFIVVK